MRLVPADLVLMPHRPPAASLISEQNVAACTTAAATQRAALRLANEPSIFLFGRPVGTTRQLLDAGTVEHTILFRPFSISFCLLRFCSASVTPGRRTPSISARNSCCNAVHLEYQLRAIADCESELDATGIYVVDNYKMFHVHSVRVAKCFLRHGG